MTHVGSQMYVGTVVLQNLAKKLAHARNFTFKMNGKVHAWVKFFARFCKTAVATSVSCCPLWGGRALFGDVPTQTRMV